MIELFLMAKDETILRFDKVSFEYGHNKPILDEVSFPLRRCSKVTIMGQNGAGKSTMFQLITGTLKPELGIINIIPGMTTALSRQVISQADMQLTVRQFLEKSLLTKVYYIDPKIDKVHVCQK